MSEPTPFPDLKLARQQAAEWIAKMDRGLDATEIRELSQWQANVANARTLRELTTTWNDMDQLTVLADMYPRRAPAARVQRRRLWPLAVAASVLVVGCAALLALQPKLWRTPAVAQSTVIKPTRYATAVGEQRVVTLADGSTLALNTDTVVDVSLQAGVRDLSLLRGEAHFTVAHDTARPFLVTVGSRVIRAVGTAFDIRLRDSNALDVLVTEGIVGLGRTGAAVPQGDSKDPTRLSAGQLLRIDDHGVMRVQALDGSSQAAWLAWRGGMLAFDGETLENALDEFSRYTTDRFSIPDPQLRRLRIGGYFPVGDTRALLSALDSGFGLTAQRAADGRFVITRATADRTGSH